MIKNDVLIMARKAGAVGVANAYKSHILYGDWAIENFAALIRADEREACAKLCDVPVDVDDWEVRGGSDGRELCNDLAAKIRARGQE